MSKQAQGPVSCGANGCAQPATHKIAVPSEVDAVKTAYKGKGDDAVYNESMRVHEPVCGLHSAYACHQAGRKGLERPVVSPMIGSDHDTMRKLRKGEERDMKRTIGSESLHDSGLRGDTVGTEYPTQGRPYNDVIQRGNLPTQGGIRKTIKEDSNGDMFTRVGRGRSPLSAARPGRSSGSRRTGADMVERQAGFEPYDKRSATPDMERQRVHESLRPYGVNSEGKLTRSGEDRFTAVAAMANEVDRRIENTGKVNHELQDSSTTTNLGMNRQPPAQEGRFHPIVDPNWTPPAAEKGSPTSKRAGHVWRTGVPLDNSQTEQPRSQQLSPKPKKEAAPKPSAELTRPVEVMLRSLSEATGVHHSHIRSFLNSRQGGGMTMTEKLTALSKQHGTPNWNHIEGAIRDHADMEKLFDDH